MTLPGNEGTDAPEIETPTVPANEPEAPEEVAAEGTVEPEQAETEQPETPVEYEVLEYAGKKYEVPKELKAGFMMQADYTRKTQEVADQKRAVEAERAQHQAQVQALNQTFAKQVEIAQLDTALQQYANVNWAELERDNPIQAQSLFRQMAQIKDARAAAVQQLQQEHSKHLAETNAATRRRLEETRTVAQRDIKGWTPEVDAKVTEFARSFGLTDQELINVIDPRTYKLMHLAWLGSQLGQKAASEPKRASGSADIKPLRQVGQSRSKPASSSTEGPENAEEWVKWRNEQLRKRASRH